MHIILDYLMPELLWGLFNLVELVIWWDEYSSVKNVFMRKLLLSSVLLTGGQ